MNFKKLKRLFLKLDYNRKVMQIINYLLLVKRFDVSEGTYENQEQ